MLVCLNGNFIPHEDAKLPITDGGFLFGDTLFETIKARGKKILLQQEHLDRLQLSADLLDFPCPRSRIESTLQNLAAALKSDVSRIRLTLSRGPFQGLAFPATENSHFLLTAVTAEEPSDVERDSGAVCVTAPNRRVNPLNHLPQMKRGNYADCLYAANYARSKDAREALFCSSDGHLLEGSTSNLFAVIDDCLITPPLGDVILAGIMRRQVIDAATELGMRIIERNLSREEALNAQEAFLSNSLIDILPITSLDGQKLQRGTTWQALLKTLRMRIET
jgi:branched-subunit amino acid aminotransferase/4-amino-4-deoxychorismate lyase